MKIPQIKQVECPNCSHVFKPFFLEKASRGCKQVSRGLVWAIGNAGLRFGSVLDYGCGLLRNTPILKQHFKRVVSLDTKIQVERLRSMFPNESLVDFTDDLFDVVVLLSVLHIIPSRDKRISVLLDAASRLDRDGLMVVEVPTWETHYRNSTKQQHNDGFAMGNGQFPTFYKPFTATELKELIQDSGLEIVSKHITKPTACYVCRPIN